MRIETQSQQAIDLHRITLEEPVREVHSFVDLYETIQSDDIERAVDRCNKIKDNKFATDNCVFMATFDPSLRPQLPLSEKCLPFLRAEYNGIDFYNTYLTKAAKLHFLFPQWPLRLNKRYYHYLLRMGRTKTVLPIPDLQDQFIAALSAKILFPTRFSYADVSANLEREYARTTDASPYEMLEKNALFRLIHPSFMPAKHQEHSVIEWLRKDTLWKREPSKLAYVKILAAEKVIVEGYQVELIMPQTITPPVNKPLPIIRTF